uniref:RRM domain-containing protein n=1 Tax=Strigamia maritima TaxID=126957 RepID=T1JE52_STRMM
MKYFTHTLLLTFILLEPKKIITTNGEPINCGKFYDPNALLQPARGWDALTSRNKLPIFLLGSTTCNRKPRFLKGENIILKDTDEMLIRSDLLGYYPNLFYPITALNMTFQTYPWSPIDGFFTQGYINIVRRLIEKRLVTNRILFRRVIFRFELKKRSPIHPRFEKRIMDIAKLIDSKNMAVAKYKLDLIVRDYGTHYILRVDTGAIYIQQDYLDHDALIKLSQDKIDDISIAGKNAFLKKCNMSASGKVVSSAVLTAYSTLLKSTAFKFIGGAETDFCSNFNTWLESMEKQMEIVDRSGPLLHEILKNVKFKKLKDAKVKVKIGKMLEDAIGRYYNVNIHAGCLRLDSINYDAVMNFDDGSCIPSNKSGSPGDYKYYGAALISPPYSEEPPHLRVNITPAIRSNQMQLLFFKMGTRVYIGNLNSDFDYRDIDELFEGYGKIREVILKRGFGFVEFDDRRDADDAVHDLNGRKYLGKRVKVDFARPLRRDFEYKSCTPRRSKYRLVVQNLSSRISWQDLKDYMEEAGNVIYVNAHRRYRNEGEVEDG